MDYMPMSAHSLVDFGVSNGPFIRNEYLKEQPGFVPSDQQQQQQHLHNVIFPSQPLGTGAGPPAQFPLSPPISFVDYEMLQSTTPDDCYHSSTGNFEPQVSEDDDSPQSRQEQLEGSKVNAVVAAPPPVNWSNVVPWVSTKPPSSRGRPRGGKRRAAAARNVEAVAVPTTGKPPGAKRGRKPRAARQQATRAPTEEDDKAALKEAKAAHSVVERRYRDNLNGKMSQLYYVLREVNSPGPHSRLSSTSGSSGTSEVTTPLPAFQPPSRVRKSEILNSAIDYIHQSEVEMRHMADEIKHLQDKERTIRNLVKCEEWSVLRALLSS
ncbi:hypothetical protein Z517_12317 [Fonsecaea pedrosoi CBS 271.37]|uniref:BHLH domain-containing protein n=1 Tax=Fonsecaea pedrosoi CBS 271.37 TaxID=1442368 RepID=A0A0D2EJ18_9EURO|nr:uncharacterized protein Z517_12317 [Fonsecaea pedrosoi CBS 271.37]KIW74377.1 hypothetical protein Z517_12317 [Fonsecaea pedrosoi CBS 271.37]